PAARPGTSARAQVRIVRDLGPRRAHLHGAGGALVRRLPCHVPRLCANQTAHRGVPPGRRSGAVRRRRAGSGRHPDVGRERRGSRGRAGDGRAVKGRPRAPANVGIGLAGTVLVHACAGVLFLVGAANARKPAPPTYRVHLVAAPAPTEDVRKAPEAVERPAEEKPAPAPKAKSPKSTVAPAPPPPVAEIGFLIHRDGSISDMQFIKRSGSFGFDLEAQGAIEDAGRRKAFGPLPDGWTSEVLFVRFYFSGKRQ